jgi:hypothetical protein
VIKREAAMDDILASRSSAVEPYKPGEQDQSEFSGERKQSKQGRAKTSPEPPKVDVDSGEEHKLDERA